MCSDPLELPQMAIFRANKTSRHIFHIVNIKYLAGNISDVFLWTHDFQIKTIFADFIILFFILIMKLFSFRFN